MATTERQPEPDRLAYLDGFDPRKPWWHRVPLLWRMVEAVRSR
jgi:hypothetical protein